jgi:hypothetical protein
MLVGHLISSFEVPVQILGEGGYFVLFFFFCLSSLIPF